MEKLITTMRKLERRLTVYNALKLSQKEREKPGLDKAVEDFESAFEAAVMAVVKKNEKKQVRKKKSNE